MTITTGRDYERELKVLVDDINQHVDLSCLDLYDLERYYEWCLESGLTASQAIRLAFLSGVRAVLLHPDDIGVIVMGVSGRNVRERVASDDLPF